MEGIPPHLRLLRGPGRSELGIRGRRGAAPAGGSWQLSGRRKPYPPQGPAPRTLRPALIRPWLHTNPPLLPKAGAPSPWCGAEAGAGLAQEGRGWCRARCPGAAARGANSPPVLQTSLLAREKVPVPFNFLYGDATSVRWFVGIVQGRAAGGGAASQGGERFCLPLLDLPWWLGLSPFPLKTL